MNMTAREQVKNITPWDFLLQLVHSKQCHTPNEEKNDESKDTFYDELQQMFDHFSKYHMKILFGDFNAKLEREDIFKLTSENVSLHEDSNDMVSE
jgi:exonuclease III